jgi:uncharacterized protein with von Willebrand factor type A (vWA) domain
MFAYQYSRWDGSQTLNPFTAEELMDAMSDDLIADNDMRSALERLMRAIDEGRLGDRMQGLRKMLEQLRRQRQERLSRNDLSSVIDDIIKRLEEIVKLEREGIQERLDQQLGQQDNPQASNQAQQQTQGDQGDAQQADAQASPQGREREPGAQDAQEQGAQAQQQRSSDAQAGVPDQQLHKMLRNIAAKKQQYLDALPESPAGQIKALQDYEFMDAEAREKFEELLNMLRQQMLQQFSDEMRQAMQNMSPEDMQRLKEMVRDINKMLEAKAQGRDPKFDEFKQKYGDVFPDVNSLEELMEELQRRRMNMENLLSSMPGEMRQSLRDMLQQMFQDDRIQLDLAELAMRLEQMMPGRQFRQRYNFSGDEPLNFSEAMRLMEEMQDIDQLEKQMRRARDGQGLDQIDTDKVDALLGPEAARSIEQMKEITKLLEEAGYVRKVGDHYEMTPRGLNRIGQKALRDIFSDLKNDRVGNHETDRRGHAGDRADESKPYEFGDPFLLDLRATVMHAVEREGKGSPVHLEPKDFMVYRTELMTKSATVLMIDLSRSMLLRGCFSAAKKVALALDSLIRTQYPRDTLYIVGFSERAQELKPHELHLVDWNEYRYGTNLQHGLMQARRLLAKHKGGNRQIIVITDGEPTAHCEDDGSVYFDYPTSYRTYIETLKEVMRCTREGLVINTFMLERGYSLAGFVNQMTKINKGRAFFATPDRLGEYILVDYVNNRKKRVS